MKRLFSATSIWLAVLAAVMVSAAWKSHQANAPTDVPPYRIIGYVGGGTDIFNIDAAKLTHINYAFANINDEGVAYFRNPRAPQHMAQLHALKAKNPDLKILVSVGGWGADGFSDAALTDESREKFARSVVEMVKAYALDGIDLDWEFPAQRGPGIKFRPEDKQNFTLWLKAIRDHLDALSDERGLLGEDRYLVTIASNDNQRYFDNTEMDKVHQYLDFVNIMSYDMFSSGSPTTGHHTGLFQSTGPEAPTRTTADAVERHLRAGIPANKLVVGVALYGRGWTGVKPENNGLYQPFERFADYYEYDRLKEDYINKRGFRRYWDDGAKAPYLWNPDSTTWIGYDDAESMRHKAAYVKEKGLGGIMYWEHSHDKEEELLNVLSTNLNGR